MRMIKTQGASKNKVSDPKSSFDPVLIISLQQPMALSKLRLGKFCCGQKCSDLILFGWSTNDRRFIKFALHESTVRIVTTLLLLASLTFAIIAL